VRRVPTVVIDPGHGGVDPGAISPNGIHEKDIVLATASEFARELAARRNY
jgi:N-acetylmuramoyl-L-alanine amidase